MDKEKEQKEKTTKEILDELLAPTSDFKLPTNKESVDIY